MIVVATVFCARRGMFYARDAKRTRRELEQLEATRRGDLEVILESQQILQEKNHQLEEALRAAEEATRMKSLFLANMTHEIRTPLNGVVGMTELLLTTDLNSEQREYGITLRESAESLLTILNDILDFSKIEAGRLKIESVPVDPKEVASSVMALLLPRAQEKGLQFNLGVDPAVPAQMLSDPVRLRQLLTNLIGNAIKFTEAGSIGVSIERKSVDDAPMLLFAVTDTGIGITAEQSEHVFLSFTQADQSTTRRYGGTGLGLTICKQLTEAMGGALGFTSTPGSGSRFWFTLPCIQHPALKSGGTSAA
ncbi:MAG: hypothetical protein JJE04_12065 [Acidobacteriia bacterium]|nr:hypothetical protein [Terriglobia bacterium]